MQYILCEERGTKGDLCIYWRGDLKRPITFNNQSGEVPVFHIKKCLEILGMTEAQYISIISRFSE